MSGELPTYHCRLGTQFLSNMIRECWPQLAATKSPSQYLMFCLQWRSRTNKILMFQLATWRNEDIKL